MLGHHPISVAPVSGLASAVSTLIGSQPAFAASWQALTPTLPAFGGAMLALTGSLPVYAPTLLVLTSSLPAFGAAWAVLTGSQPAYASVMTLSLPTPQTYYQPRPLITLTVGGTTKRYSTEEVYVP